MANIATKKEPNKFELAILKNFQDEIAASKSKQSTSCERRDLGALVGHYNTEFNMYEAERGNASDRSMLKS